jgi:hypothetical protein
MPKNSQAGLERANLFANRQDSPAHTPPVKFDLQAEVLEGLVQLGDEPAIDRLIVKGQIELREVTDGESQPLVVRGDYFELQDGVSSHPRGALLGRPAEVVAREMQARGDKFYVYPADNRLSIAGGGNMILPARTAATGESSTRSPASIAWSRQMEFDGQVATFEGDVSVETTQTAPDGTTRCVARGDTLVVQLTRPVEFLDPKAGGPVDLAECAFDGSAFLEVDMFDVNGERKLRERMRVQQLSVNQVTGEVRGHGPGWVRGIHRGRDVLREGAAGRPVAGAESGSGLNFLRVDFQRTMAGNLHRRQLEFLQGTRTLYGPIEDWNGALDELPENQLPADAVVLTCERLAVAQPHSGDVAEQIELEATGNAFVRGNAFSATAGRISYARAKDQLILEGDGRNKATLAYQKQASLPPSTVTADKVLYRLSTRELQLTGWDSGEINGVSQLRGQRIPPK